MITPDDKKKLAGNTVALTLVQFVSYVSPLLILPYLSRILTLENYGLLMFYFSYIQIGLVVTDFGFNLSAPIMIIENLDVKKKVNQIIGSIYTLKILFNVIFAFITILYFSLKRESFQVNNLNIFVLICIILTQSFQPIWFFQGIERLKSVTIYTFISRIVYLCIVLLTVKSDNDLTMVLVSYMASQGIASGLGLYGIYQNGYGISKPTIGSMKKIFWNSLFFFLSRASVSLFTSFSTFLVGNFSGMENAAFFGSAEKLYQGGQSLTRPISQAVYPYLARSRNAKFVKKYISILLIPLIVGVIICIIFAENIIVLFYGSSFITAALILRIFLVVTVINFISVNFGYPAFASVGKLEYANKSVIYGGFLQLLMLIVLFITNKMNGVFIVTAVLITEIYIMIYRVVRFNKELNCC